MATLVTGEQLALVADELAILVQETIGFRRETEAQAILEEVLRTVMHVRRRIERSQRRYVVAMVGLTNVGKSTLLNALLGADLAPRRNGPCTAVPIEIAYGDTYRVTAHYRRQLRRPAWNCATVAAIHDRLAELAGTAHGNESPSLSKVLVEAPRPLLADGLILADTPGFGAAQAHGSAGTHEAVLRQYLQETTQVFWVVLAEQGIGQREKSFHDELFAEVCDDVVVTGCENWNREDRSRFKQRYAHAFDRRMPSFHFASGLAGLAARTNDDTQALEAAGITLLERRIRQLADPDKRSLALAGTLIALANDLGRWWQEFAVPRRTSAHHCWRPDSWARWLTFAPEDRLVRAITRRLKAKA